jgi:hypothetical protein
MKLYLIFLSFLILLTSNCGKFELRDGKFFLNNEEFWIKAGEIHYSRIPR